jgi:hypothetical protein
MLRRVVGLLIVALIVLCGLSSPVRAGKLIVGGVSWKFDQFAEVVVFDAAKVTGMAFKPGSRRLAFCRGDEAESWLYTVEIPRDFFSRRPGKDWPNQAPDIPDSKPIWTAPKGSVLRKPIWSPDGGSILVTECRDDRRDLVLIDLVECREVWRTHDSCVVDAFWHPNARQFVFVSDDDASRQIWLQTNPPSEIKKLGDGGIAPRWELPATCSWLEAVSAQEWTEHCLTDLVSVVNRAIPAKPVGSIWSPDGIWGAALVEDGAGVSLFRRDGQASDTVKLPDRAQRILGWTPDNSLLILVEEKGEMLAVAREPVAPEVRKLVASEVSAGIHDLYAIDGRTSSFGWPMQEEAGLAWTLTSPQAATGQLWTLTLPGQESLVAYVVRPSATQAREKRLGIWTPREEPRLVVSRIEREYLGSNPEDQRKLVERQTLHYNMAVISIAMRDYLEMHDQTFPEKVDNDSMRSALGWMMPEGLADKVFYRPGTSEWTIRWLVAGGYKVTDQTKEVVSAVIDYPGSYHIVLLTDSGVLNRDGSFIEK